MKPDGRLSLKKLFELALPKHLNLNIVRVYICERERFLNPEVWTCFNTGLRDSHSAVVLAIAFGYDVRIPIP